MNFEYADKVLKDLNRRNLRLFDKLKLMPFDELNVLRSVRSAYERSAELAKKRYLWIARDAYIEAYMLVTGCSEKDAEKKADESITEDYIIEMLDEYDPITLYRFESEIERKAERLAEALLASEMKAAEVDKALRSLTLQEAQYADKSVERGTLTGYKDAGIKYVRWNIEKDNRVCKLCKAKDGHVYPIGNIPKKPHIHCRCYFTPVDQ